MFSLFSIRKACGKYVNYCVDSCLFSCVQFAKKCVLFFTNANIRGKSAEIPHKHPIVFQTPLRSPKLHITPVELTLSTLSTPTTITNTKGI